MSKRDAIVTAAKELLCERGYGATSPRAVLERSGAGQGSLYHHFRGKEDLARIALGEVSAELRGSFDAASAHASPLARVVAFLELPRNALKGCRMGRFALEPAIEQDPIREPVAAYFEHILDGVEGALREAQQRHAIPAEADAEALATALVAVVQGGYVLARAFQDERRLELATSGALALVAALEEPCPTS